MTREKRGPGRPKIDRSERIPLGTIRRKLSFEDQDPNFVYRWVNDLPGRLANAEAGGYEYVVKNMVENDKVGDQDITNEDRGIGEKISAVVDKKNGMRAYLMRIKRQWYEEDQAAKQRPHEEFDKALKRGQDQHSQQVGQSYIPESGMKIGRNR